jgi:outer membrane protein assembly factor BamB
MLEEVTVAAANVLFIGIKGCVVALDKSTGEEVWRAKLGGSDFVNLVIEDASIYAATSGEVFCLSPASGEIRWHNPLKGMGRGLVTIGLPGEQSTALAEKWRRDQAAASAAAAAAVTS